MIGWFYGIAINAKLCTRDNDLMRLLLKEGRMYSVLTAVLLCFSSCMSYYWTPVSDADLKVGDKVYKVETLSGDAVNFRAHPGSSAVFDGEVIRGIDTNGDQRIIGLSEVSEIELANWQPETVYLVSGAVAVVILYVAIDLITQGSDTAAPGGKGYQF